MSFTCEECGFDLWRYVGKVSIWTRPDDTCHSDEVYCHVGLYSDHRYPGRCLVVFPRHVENLEDLDAYDMEHFMMCVTKVGRAVKKIVGAKRMNYAVLGNAVPHVHAHVIPRFETDPNPNKSPWNRHDKADELTKKRANQIIKDIRKALL